MVERLSSNPEPKEHYPYVTRSILRLMGKNALTNVTAVDVEPDYGYITRLTYTDGSHRITYGNDLGLNTAAACDLAKDKGHTKFMLRTIGINCPEGDEFLLPWWYEKIRQTQLARGNVSMKTVDSAPEYIEGHMDYPVYVKPVDGSKGGDIFYVHNQTELEAVFELYDTKRMRVAMVEVPINMPDYRIVSLDGELISAYRRIPLSVVGDGSSTIRELINELQGRYENEGRDTRLNPEDERIRRYLAGKNMTIESVPDSGRAITLVPISNLSAGGTAEDVTDSISPRWAELAAQVGENFNLRLLGLDLACDDITSASANYSVIEVNAAPGLDHYALSGEAQRQLVDELYTKVLNTFPDK